MEKCIVLTLTNTRQHSNRLPGSDRRTHHKTPHPLVAVHLCQDLAHVANSIPENRPPACNSQEQAQAKKMSPLPTSPFLYKDTSILQQKKDMHGFSNYTIYLDQSTATLLPCSFLQSCYF